jgi:hypothetical protein
VLGCGKLLPMYSSEGPAVALSLQGREEAILLQLLAISY